MKGLSMGTVAAALAVLAWTPAASASSVLKTDVEGLTTSSDVVVRGKVLRKESRWSGDGARIFTDVEVQVDEAMKGQGAKTITVRQPGGEVGDIAQKVSGLASFSDGEEVVLFLERRGSTYRVSGLAQGKYRIERSSDGKFAFAIPEDQSELRLVDPKSGQALKAGAAAPMELNALRDRVRKAAAAAPAKGKGAQ